MPLQRWWRAVMRWIGAWINLRGAASGPGGAAAIEPHPRMETDQGERDQIEGLMEADSLHVGRRP